MSEVYPITNGTNGITIEMGTGFSTRDWPPIGETNSYGESPRLFWDRDDIGGNLSAEASIIHPGPEVVINVTEPIEVYLSVVTDGAINDVFVNATMTAQRIGPADGPE